MNPTCPNHGNRLVHGQCPVGACDYTPPDPAEVDPSGVTIHYALPNSRSTFKREYRRKAVVKAIVDTLINESGDDLTDTEDVFFSYGAIRYPAELILGRDPTELVDDPEARAEFEDTLPDRVSVMIPYDAERAEAETDGGRDATDPERWLGYMVSNSESMVHLTIESAGESYTLDQARGIRDAIDVAIARADRGKRTYIHGTDGGRNMQTQPETCPKCGMTLRRDGSCRTENCPGPDGS